MPGAARRHGQAAAAGAGNHVIIALRQIEASRPAHKLARGTTPEMKHLSVLGDVPADYQTDYQRPPRPRGTT